jgi:proteasome ATPase
MPRNRTEIPLDPLLATTFSDDEKLSYAGMVRDSGADATRRLDQFLIANIGRLTKGLRQAEEKLHELGDLCSRLTAPPLHAATFIKLVELAQGQRALVLHGSSQRVVGIEPAVAGADLRAGDEVFLASNLNVIMARSPRGARLVGETGVFDRLQQDGSVVVKSRDEELVVDAAPGLDATTLAAGDLIRFDRNAWMAFGRVERGSDRRFMLEDVPDFGVDQIGGLDGPIETVFSALTMAIVNPDRAASYGLVGQQSILLIGPPGCGKTRLVRAAASDVMRKSGKRCRIAVVKPAEWESAWVGETQANIRAFFKSLREAAADGPVLAFFDEIEAVGRHRGSRVDRHSDKFLAAFLAELDGFTDRRNVAIVSATNRKDLIDAALLERISDIEVLVGRPNAKAARAIFRIHLPATLPFSPNGSAAQKTREELVDAAVSRFYSPNADNAISVIRFRDGRERTITAREMASGRVFEQVCRQARRAALQREIRGEGEPGVCVADIAEAADHAIERMRSTLTIENAHSHLSDLPQDVGVVSVQPIARKVKQPGRYLNA